MPDLTLSDNVDILNPDEKRIILAVDSQVLSKIQSCNQRAAYRHVDNIELHEKNDTALVKGLVIHEGLAEYYSKKHLFSFDELKSMCFGRMTSFASTKTDLNRDDINNCIDAVSSYLTEYRYETWKVKFRNNEPLVERTFAKRMYEDDEVIILYTGVTDLIIDQMLGSTEVSMPVDHKSYSSGWFKAATMTNQFHGYCWAARSSNLIINRIGVGTKVGSNERITASYTPEEIKEWETNTVYEILNHLTMMKRNWFRKNYEACEEYGGCSYKILCNASPSSRNSIIRAHYKVMPIWSPLDRG